VKSFLILKQGIEDIALHYTDLRDRLTFVADLCAYREQGDLAEIGSGRGGMTTKLAAVARKYSRHIIAIEPWEIGIEGCQEGDRSIFYHSILPYKDIVDVWEHSSLTISTVKDIWQRQLCFAYVDGLRVYPAGLADIITMSHAAVIAVRMDGIDFAVGLAADLIGKTVIQVDGKEEAYLL
jgi:hypothetical protein